MAIQRKCREIASRGLYLKLVNTVELQDATQEDSTGSAALPFRGDDERRDAHAGFAFGLDAGNTYEFTANVGPEELFRA